MTHVITKKDLFFIISAAKKNMLNLRLPMQISGSEVDQSELTTIAIAESLITYFNANKLFTKLPEFDYTDTSCQFESDEE